MPGFRRRKEKSQTTSLDPSWILPSDEGQKNSAAPSNEFYDITLAESIDKHEQSGLGVTPLDSSNPPNHQAILAGVDKVAPREQGKTVNISHQHIVPQHSPTKSRKPRYAKRHSSMWLDESSGSSASTGHHRDDIRKETIQEEEPQADTSPFVTAPSDGYHFSFFRTDRTPTASPGNAAPPVPPWRYLSSSYSPRNGSL